MGDENPNIDGKIEPFSRNNTTTTTTNNNNNFAMEISVAEASSMFPGFRFSPTDEELIQYYLRKKLIQGSDQSVKVIPEVDICRYEPWNLPAQSIIHSENEWFFFSPRGRKYPNGSQSKRATKSGYWKATGKERCVKSGLNAIGTKRTLVFHMGRAPKGQRTEWIMLEYCTSDKSQNGMAICRLRKNNEFNLNDNKRRSALNQTNLLEANESITGLSGGEKVAESSTKECSSSNNSHSVEQDDCASEFDEKLLNEFSHHGSSSRKKDCDEEEDCYADIMKDDIIKLDDSSYNPNSPPSPVTAINIRLDPQSKQQDQSGLSMLPFQGTTNRRLRLRRHFDVHIFGEDSVPLEEIPHPRFNHGFSSRLSIARIRNAFGPLLLVVFVSILLLCFMGFLLKANYKLVDVAKLYGGSSYSGWYGYPSFIIR